MQQEFQQTVKRLKTDITDPDFTPFKQVKEKKVRLKKTRIRKKPLEYMGSGIGSSSAQTLRNSKKLSVFKNITALKTDKEPLADKNGI
jgi:hypothetical protein